MKIKIKCNGFAYSNEVSASVGSFLKKSLIRYRYYIRALNFLNTIIKLQLFKITMYLFLFIEYIYILIFEYKVLFKFK